MPARALLIATAVFTVLAAPAVASRPRPGVFVGFSSRLADFDTLHAIDSLYDRDVSARLVVGQKHRVSGRGSKLTFTLPCHPGTRTVRFVDRPRISPGGTFRTAQRSGRVRYRLRGRFLDSGVARVVYRASWPPWSHGRGRCRGRGRVVLTRDGKPPSFRGCRAQRAVTRAQSSTGRLFEQMSLEPGFAFVPTLYGCLFADDRRLPLDTVDEAEGVFASRVAGPYAAYGYQECWDSGCVTGVEEWDLHRGRRLRRAALDDALNFTQQPSSGFEVPDLELAATGSFALVIGDGGDGYAVVVADTIGARRLDVGAIAPDSLTLSGSTVSWVKDGAVRSAVLH